MNDRQVTKVLMQQQRGGVKTRCDWCGQYSSVIHMHEIIDRRFTKKGSVARILSYSQEVCALLCPTCHEKAHQDEACSRVTLFRLNYRRFGYEAVAQVFNEIASLVRLPFELPEEE